MTQESIPTLEFISPREYVLVGATMAATRFVPLDGAEPTEFLDNMAASPGSGEMNLARAGGRWFRRDYAAVARGEIWREIEAAPLEREFGLATETVKVKPRRR